MIRYLNGYRLIKTSTHPKAMGGKWKGYVYELSPTETVEAFTMWAEKRGVLQFSVPQALKCTQTAMIQAKGVVRIDKGKNDQPL